MGYFKLLISVCAEHKWGWWFSLIITYALGIGWIAAYRSGSEKLMDWLNLSLPELSVPWLFLPLFVWLTASFAHREVKRRSMSGRVQFGDPKVIRDVPLHRRWKGSAASAGSENELLGHHDIACVEVSNVPYDPTAGKAIEHAFGSVTMYDMQWQQIKHFDYARWTNNPKPGYEGNPSDHYKDEWNYRSIQPNSSQNRLDFALKAKGDSEAFGFRGQSQLKDMWKDHELSVPPGRYRVRIMIKGTPMNLSNGLWVELENPGKYSPLQVSRLTMGPVERYYISRLSATP